MATGVYVDGMNLFYGALKGTPNKWLDLRSLADLLVPQDEILTIKYFTARVKSRSGQRDAARLQDLYLRAIRCAGGVEIFEGRMTYRSRRKPIDDRAVARNIGFHPQFRPNFLFRSMWRRSIRERDERGIGLASVLIEEEKRSDVSLAVHLVADCARGLVDKAIIITNDSDLVDALLVARSFGVIVGIVNPHRSAASRQLAGAATFELVLRKESLAKCQFPDVVSCPGGVTVSRPKEWT